MDNIALNIDNLFDSFENSKLYKDFISAKKQLESNEEIMDIITKIKRLQKIATNNKDEMVEKEIRDLYKKLESYPLYQSYLIIKDLVQNELFAVKEQFEKYFKNILNLDDKS